MNRTIAYNMRAITARSGGGGKHAATREVAMALASSSTGRRRLRAAAIVAQLRVPSRAIQTTCTRLPWLGDQCCLGVAAFGLAERALHGRATLGHLSSHDQLIIWLG
jgi:hypothetical protein